MKILRDVGVRLHHPEVVRHLRDAGVRVQGDVAFFTENQVMDLVAEAPSKFTLKARNPRYDIEIGGDGTCYAPPYGAINIAKGNGTIRPGVLQDYINFAELVHQSPHLHANGGILVQPSDIDPFIAPAIMFYLSARISDKPLIAPSANPDITGMILRMTEILAGGADRLSQATYLITPVNTTSPLQMDRLALDTLLAFARAGQAVMVSPCVMAGTTGPVTLAGTIAMANAEALAGIAIAQIIRPGTPALYGFQSTAADMKTGNISIGGPDRSLCIAFGARLARAYNLPSRGGGMDTDALDVSEQSGYESMMTLLITRQEHVNFVLHSIGMAASFSAVSYQLYIYGLEMLGMIEHYKKRLPVNDDTLALDVIKKVGIGGQFMTDPHTLKHCRQAFYMPMISHRGPLGAFKDNETALKSKINRTIETMQSDYRRPALSDAVLENLRGLFAEKEIDLAPIDRLMED